MTKSAATISASELSEWIKDSIRTKFPAIIVPPVNDGAIAPAFPHHAVIVGLIIKDRDQQGVATQVANEIFTGVTRKLELNKVKDLNVSSPVVLPSPHGTIVGFIQSPAISKL